MTSRPDHDRADDVLDDQLLAELGRVLDLAEPPGQTDVAVAHAALGWRTLDAELATLVHDSNVDDAELVLRSTDERCVLAFANDRIRIDVEFAGGQLVGQVAPPQPAIVELHRFGSREPISAAVDEFGAFVLIGVSSGPATLVFRVPDASWSVRTSWTSL